MISPGLNLVMTVIGFAVSTMFIVFVCTRLICARIQLHASTRSFVRSDLSIMERGIHGLEPVVVSSFPTKFVEQFTYGQDKQSCSVCLSEYQEKDLLRVLPYCGHAFHGNCIDTWLKHHWTCPVCRISLRDSPDRKRKMQPAPSASMPPLARENFIPDSSYCQSSADEGSEFVPDPVRVNAVSGRPEVLVAAGLPPTFESREKQTENPLDS